MQKCGCSSPTCESSLSIACQNGSSNSPYSLLSKPMQLNWLNVTRWHHRIMYFVYCTVIPARIDFSSLLVAIQHAVALSWKHSFGCCLPVCSVRWCSNALWSSVKELCACVSQYIHLCNLRGKSFPFWCVDRFFYHCLCVS